MTDEEITAIIDAATEPVYVVKAATVRRMAEALREAREVLRRVEWQGEREDMREEGDGWVLTCPCCKATVITGHADCALARVLG